MNGSWTHRPYGNLGLHRKALLAVAALCAFFAIGTPTAFGAYVEIGSFAGGGDGPGGAGSGNGQLSNPGQADVNETTGELYVTDTGILFSPEPGDHRVQIFKPNATGGEYDSQASVPGAFALAIDQATGDVYVATDTGVSKFDEDLAPIAAGWSDPGVSGPLAVDPVTGDLLVADTAGSLIRRFNSDGSADGSFAAERPVDLDVDSTGDVLVVTSTGDVIANCGATATVKRFSAAGVEESTVGASLSAPGAVAVDPDDDSIVVASRVNQWNCGSEVPLISFFAADGTERESIALTPNTQYAMVPGLAAQGGGSTRVYAVTKSPFKDTFGATKITALEIPPPRAPEVLGQSVLRGSTDATLRAGIGAGGLATEYHFEYGTTAAYGEETEPGTLPAGFEAVLVSADISGLAPETTYHFRVVASNAEGEVQGADRTFTTTQTGGGSCPNEAFRTGPSAHLSDCRAFELVTPPDSDADIRVIGGPTAPDGNTTCFNTEDALADADPNGIKTADQGFCAWRGPDGWQTKWVTGPAPAERVSSMGSNVYFVSPDGQRAVFASDAALFGQEYVPPPGSTHGGPMSAYLWEGGETTWIAPGSPPVGDPPEYLEEGTTREFSSEAEGGYSADRRPLAASDDLTHGIFESDLPIVPGDENGMVDVYEWYPGGVRLVSRDASGKAAGGRSGIRASLQMKAPPGAVSADGSRIFFMHDGAPLAGDATEAPEGLDPSLGFGIGFQSVYMREGDEVTLVSPRRGVGPDASVWFAGASADGETVFLETTQQLTPDPKQPGRAIYTYDVGDDELELLADALGGVELLAISRDGSTAVYWELVSKELIAVRDGSAEILGTLDVTDISGVQRVASDRYDQRALRITPDGRVVVFAAAGEFAGGSGPVQIYRWEAGKGVEQISANPGEVPIKNASIAAYGGLILSEREELFAQHTSGGNQGRVVSDDGSRVFFETPEGLVKADVNGLTDVYEWHDGEINIISTGTGPKALYHGSSADGRTVFITTFDRLAPGWDRNSKRDLYVARPDGGFAPPPTPSGCQGEACQPGQAAPPPTVAGRGAGDGNLQRGLAAAALAKGGKSVRVSVLAPGRITVTLSGKLGKGKPVTVAKTSKVARKAGAVTLPLKLSGKAKKQLAKRGRLSLTLTVEHAQSDQTITRKVTLHG